MADQLKHPFFLPAVTDSDPVFFYSAAFKTKLLKQGDAGYVVGHNIAVQLP